MKRYLKYIAIALLVVLALLLLPLLLLVFGIWYCYDWCRERMLLRQLRSRASFAVEEVQETPLPAPLNVPRPRRLNWGGGYLDGGVPSEIPRYLHFLRHGVPTKAVVLHYWGETSGGEHNSTFYYAFKDLKGRIRIEKGGVGNFDSWAGALSRGRGSPVPSMDLDLATGTILTVLLDPQSDAHLLYDSLLVTRW